MKLVKVMDVNESSVWINPSEVKMIGIPSRFAKTYDGKCLITIGQTMIVVPAEEAEKLLALIQEG